MIDAGRPVVAKSGGGAGVNVSVSRRGTLGVLPLRGDALGSDPEKSATVEIVVVEVALDERPRQRSHGSHAYGVTVAQLVAYDELAHDPVDITLCISGHVLLCELMVRSATEAIGLQGAGIRGAGSV